MQLRSNTWKKDLCTPRLCVCGMAQNMFIKTRANNLTRPEHTSRHNVLTKHFHMAWLQPDFSLRAKALWVVSWLFLWPPQWSQFPVRSYSVSVCDPTGRYQQLTSHWETGSRKAQNSHSSCLGRYKNPDRHIPDHLLFRANVPLTQPLNL